jgi:hypothetical protein
VVCRQEAEAAVAEEAEEAPKKKKKKAERYFDGAPSEATNGAAADGEQPKVRLYSGAAVTNMSAQNKAPGL